MANVIFSDFRLDRLNKHQLNDFGKYLIGMYLTASGYQVLTKNLNERASFLLVRINKEKTIHVYVRTARPKKAISYSFLLKSTWNNKLDNTIYVALVSIDKNIPSLYLIPSSAWEKPNALFVDRNYDKEGQISAPEWGISTSQKNAELMQQYEIKKQLQLLAGHK
jgi:hypothetical protein